jgi:hypothetical protein
MEDLNDTEERVLLYLWIEPSIIHLHKNLDPFANPEQIDIALGTLVDQGFLVKTRRNVYSIPLKIRRKYSYEPASLSNGGYPKLVPEEDKQPVKRKKRRRT